MNNERKNHGFVFFITPIVDVTMYCIEAKYHGFVLENSFTK